MGKYERRMFFESLCAMRDDYAALPADDATAVLPLAEVEAYVATVFADLVAADLAADAAAAGQQARSARRSRLGGDATQR